MIGTLLAIAIFSQFSLGYLDALDYSLSHGELWGTDYSLESFEFYFDMPVDWHKDESQLDDWQRGGIAFVRDSMRGRTPFLK